ncbi:MAG: hypothetical protein AB7I50_02795 [Vicinamibacterales bacterium]
MWLLCLAFMAWGCRESVPRSTDPLWRPPATAQALEAEVTFSGTQIAIANRSTEVWRDVRISVGRAGDPPAYTYRTDAILPGRTLVMGVLNFARPDDTRLNPFRVPPTRWAVLATLETGHTGFSEGLFE